MKILLPLVLGLFFLSPSVFAHEVMLGCVSSKNECKVRARKAGYTPLRTVRDAARCPGPQKLACIVFH